MSELHRPQRPSWTCPRDGQPWPCELARQQLRVGFLHSSERLSLQMAWLMDTAARDLAAPDPAKLYRQFIRWTVDDPGPCGRCGKHDHQALPGLPPRLYATTKRVSAMDAHYVGRLERGARHWPNPDYRAGFRAVLGVETDAGLGFFRSRRINYGLDASGESSLSVPDGATPMRLVVQPGMAVIVMPSRHPLLLSLAGRIEQSARPLGAPSLVGGWAAAGQIAL